MMDFPNAPTINQTFGNYIWDGEKWKQVTVAAGTPVAGNALPLAAGTASAGTASAYAREDHVHPSAGGGGAPPAITPPLMDGVAAIGISNYYAREDHRHPSDTSHASLNSPAFVGTPTAPTPTFGTDDNKIATTAFVNAAVASGGGGGGGGPLPATALPIMDGSASIGVSARYTREDHIHPSDTSRAALNSPLFSGDPRAPTPNPGNNSISIATTAFVAASLATTAVPPATVLPLMDGTGAVGTATKYAREDHIHPIDTSRAPLNSPVFVGNPQAPTPSPGDNDISIATTAFVATAIASVTGVNVVRGFIPGGRLTFQNGNPVMSGNVSAGDRCFYFPYMTGFVPVYDGALWTLADVSTSLSCLNSDSAKSPAPVAANSIYDYFVWNDAGVIRLSRSAAWSGSTTRVNNLTRQDGIIVNSSGITNGPLTARGTWVGTAMSSAAAALDWQRGSVGNSGAQQARLNLWNAYNRVLIRTVVSDNTASWSNGGTVWREANGASAFTNVVFVTGGGDDDIEASYKVTCQGAGAIPGPPFVGVGVDSIVAPSGVCNPAAVTGTSAAITGTSEGWYGDKLPQPSPGSHTISALEKTGTFFGVQSGTQTAGLIVKMNM
jgi:hypothetical protein